MRNTLPVVFTANTAWCLQCGKLAGTCGCVGYRNILTPLAVKKMFDYLQRKEK